MSVPTFPGERTGTVPGHLNEQRFRFGRAAPSDSSDRKPAMTDTPPPALAILRQSIDNIDTALISMLAERFRCTQAVGELKARYGLPPADPQRESRQIERLRNLAASAHLDPDFAEKFLAFIIREVIRHHEAIAREAEAGEEAKTP